MTHITSQTLENVNTWQTTFFDKDTQQKIKELISNYEVEMEKTITDRWKSDMASD